MKPVSAILVDLEKSMAKYPKIKAGQDCEGYR